MYHFSYGVFYADPPFKSVECRRADNKKGLFPITPYAAIRKALLKRRILSIWFINSTTHVKRKVNFQLNTVCYEWK